MRGAFYEANNAASKILSWFSDGPDQESRREGLTDARSAVGFCLGSGLFGSYNSG